MDKDKLYSMKIGEVKSYSVGELEAATIVRVPGGWIYKFVGDYYPTKQMNAVFVPYVQILEEEEEEEYDCYDGYTPIFDKDGREIGGIAY